MAGELLRFATAGSVDDGKSTLIGRLLYDSKSLFTDQLDAVEAVSRDRGDDYTDLALLTDGLRAEREQGITIDVAYRFFATPSRSFIIADTPGHVRYTRNMVTGASTADLALILVDARHGIQEQPFVVTMPGEKPQRVKCRMRSLGCSPCTGAIRSEADTVPKIIDELIATRQSERLLRIIDHDQDGSMEVKKREGYF